VFIGTKMAGLSVWDTATSAWAPLPFVTKGNIYTLAVGGSYLYASGISI
jgi:hypothetical protein